MLFVFKLQKYLNKILFLLLENKLKQVYIPNYNKPSINLINSAQTPSECIKSNYPCEGCNVYLFEFNKLYLKIYLLVNGSLSMVFLGASKSIKALW